MAKPIRLNNEEIEMLAEAFKNNLRKAKTFNGTLKIEQKIESKDAKATIVFSERAWIKQKTLVDIFNGEVAWHGTVSRIDDTTFYIDDILCYPQDVSSVTVDVDEPYVLWRESLPDDINERIFFQGHSHVNMAVSPSGTDMDTRHRTLNTMNSNDSFYIFLIMNKSIDISAEIYDMKTNTIYEDEDIDIEVDGFSEFYEFVESAQSMVKEKKYTYSSSVKKTKTEPKKVFGEADYDKYPVYSSGYDKIGDYDYNKGVSHSPYVFGDDDDDEEFWNRYCRTY